MGQNEERIRTISLRGGREAIVGVRDTEGNKLSCGLFISKRNPRKQAVGEEKGFYACFY